MIPHFKTSVQTPGGGRPRAGGSLIRGGGACMVAPSQPGRPFVADIFREIDEELRQDRAAKLWKQYGKFVLAFAVLIVLAVAGYQGWQQYRASQRLADSARYGAALELVREGKHKEARDLFAAIAREASTGYAGLACLQEAGMQVRLGDLAGAAAAYEAISADTRIEDPLRRLALLQSVQLRVDDASADPRVLIGRLAPLAEGRGAWRSSALELMAILALRAGDQAAARGHLQRLADDLEAPEGLRARATELLFSLGG